MAVGDAHVFPSFLTTVLTQLFFLKPATFFSHASAEVRGENMPERKFASTGDRTHNHEVMSATHSPLRHGWGESIGNGLYKALTSNVAMFRIAVHCKGIIKRATNPLYFTIFHRELK